MTSNPQPMRDGASESLRAVDPIERPHADRVPGPPLRHRVTRWWPLALAATFALALVATGFIAYAIGADLTTARATIATQRENLASTTARLDVANARAGDLATEVGTLRAQVQHQQDCVVALRADTAAALRVEDAQTKLHNLYAVGSTFDKAQRARDAALRAAALDYYNAYDAAWDGLYATANSWIDRANSQMSIASRKLETMNAQIDKMNALKNRIEGMLSTAGDALAACGSDGSNAA